MDGRKTLLLIVMIENIVRSLLSCSYKIIFLYKYFIRDKKWS